MLQASAGWGARALKASVGWGARAVERDGQLMDGPLIDDPLLERHGIARARAGFSKGCSTKRSDTTWLVLLRKGALCPLHELVFFRLIRRGGGGRGDLM